MDFVAIDFETANELPTSAIELGLAVVRNYKIVETRSWLIRPPDLRFNPYTTKIHGLSAKDVRDVASFETLWPEISKYFENELVVAHNADFDLKVLRSLLIHYKLKVENIQYACSIKLAKQAFTGHTSYGLKNLARDLGIELDHHRAESDAKACALIAARAFRTFSVSILPEISIKMNIIPTSINNIPKPVEKRPRKLKKKI
jgi:DNA polymerase-3 subunit epsilon